MRDLWPFWNLSLRRLKTRSWENSKWPKPIQLTSNPKNKGTLFYSIWKVGENKVSLFFGLEVKWMGHSHFEFSLDFVFWRLRLKSHDRWFKKKYSNWHFLNTKYQRSYGKCFHLTLKIKNQITPKSIILIYTYRMCVCVLALTQLGFFWSPHRLSRVLFGAGFCTV